MTDGCQAFDVGPMCQPDEACTTDADCPVVDGTECVESGCDLLLGVCAVVPTYCDDGDPCTDDECGTDTVTCNHTPNGAPGCQ